MSLARLSRLQCFNVGHNDHGINLFGAVMIIMPLWENNMQTDNLALDLGHLSLFRFHHQYHVYTNTTKSHANVQFETNGRNSH